MPPQALGKLTEVCCCFYLPMAECTGSGTSLAQPPHPVLWNSYLIQGIWIPSSCGSVAASLKSKITKIVNQKLVFWLGSSSHIGPIFHLASGLRSNSCISRVLTARENGDSQLELLAAICVDSLIDILERTLLHGVFFPSSKFACANLFGTVPWQPITRKCCVPLCGWQAPLHPMLMQQHKSNR
jgi:hypothetical protein